MIQFIVCSKNRACQLDLTLSSMKSYFKEWASQTVDIIYTYSSNEYKIGYDRVMKLHPEFNWIKETNYHNDTINVFNKGTTPYVSFLVDDDVMINDLTLQCPEFQEFLNNSQIACFSGRMSPHINYCYTANIPAPQPKFNTNRTWNWQDPSLRGDWNYPMSIASFHVFRRDDLTKTINIEPFSSPNYFEQALANNPPMNRPLMICCETAKFYCATLNRVQNDNANRNENSAPLDILNREFVAGRRLSPTANYNLMSNAAHGKVYYVWI